jgi:hypothetical protein
MAKVNAVGEILCEQCASKSGMMDGPPKKPTDDGVPRASYNVTANHIDPSQPITAGGMLGCDDCGQPLD